MYCIMRIIITILILLPVQSFYAQLSDFYDREGRLIADTTYKIEDYKNIPEFTMFSGVKNELVAQLIRNINYPSEWIDMHVQCVLIIEIEISKSNSEVSKKHNIGSISSVKYVYNKELEWLEKTLPDLNFFDSPNYYFIFNKDYKIPEGYKIYIPIQFIHNLSEEHSIKKSYSDHIIKIEANSIPLIIID